MEKCWNKRRFQTKEQRWTAEGNGETVCCDIWEIHLIQASVPGARQRHRIQRGNPPRVMFSSLIWLGSGVLGGGVSTSLIQRLPRQGVKVVDLLRSVSSKWFWGHQGSGQRVIQLWNKHPNKISPFITLTRSKIHQQVTNLRTSIVFASECQTG